MAQETGTVDQRRRPHLQDMYQADASLVECSKKWDDLEEDPEYQGTRNPDCTAEEIQATQRASLELKSRTLSAVL